MVYGECGVREWRVTYDPLEMRVTLEIAFITATTILTDQVHTIRLPNHIYHDCLPTFNPLKARAFSRIAVSTGNRSMLLAP